MQLGTFIWRELYSRDPTRVRGFYGELFGWSLREMDMGGVKYPTLMLRDRYVGGLLPIDKRLPTGWLAYVAVSDTKAVVKRAVALGCRQLVAPTVLDGAGTYAVLADFDGAVFGIHQSQSGGQSEAPRMEPGAFVWESIATTDPKRTTELYRSLFGWTLTAAPDGTANMVFAAATGGVAHWHAAEGRPPAWMSYVYVEQIERATARAKALGATLVLANQVIEKVGAVSILVDPAGATLSLFEPRR